MDSLQDFSRGEQPLRQRIENPPWYHQFSRWLVRAASRITGRATSSSPDAIRADAS